ncbi:DMT family transporter [Clostridium oryzae]|uniref:Putative DMT superfamily transporter inner membrane protein n=1 Tax=Clostridium oryzae TaxID=1450648 RepID=A0A1V4IJA6_9CLOT|nr:DMT family transporter [Clostridium oryzae]OPJ59795.1 putative DMT superfamily transporter inner membrane protein [Clostridium oryzae]
MHKKQLQSNLILLLTAAIWGLAFVAQRVGAKHVGTFTFNGIRFMLGGLSLLPLILYFGKNTKASESSSKSNLLTAGFIAGIVLFIASSLQQAGLEYTTAGKSAFITGFYIALVPILGIFLKHKTSTTTWLGVCLAIIGLYLLSVNENFSVSFGDFLELAGAFFWALHILLIDSFIKKYDSLKLSFTQTMTCSILSLLAAIILEPISIVSISSAAVPILYGGICSVGIAYTLQIIGQKNAKPSHAAIILSMESVFANIGGVIILGENLGLRGYIGCALMLSGMLLSQIRNSKKQ